MKKIIIYLSLVLTLLLNVVPVYAATYVNIQYFYIIVNADQYNDETFCLNSEDYTLRIVDYYTNQVYNASFNKKAYADDTYYYSFRTNLKFNYDSTGTTEYDYDIYIVNSEGITEYHLFIDNATTYMHSFNDFSVYVEEDNNSGENTESPDNSESPENSGSTEDGGGAEDSQNINVDILHNDLLILIVIISFFEFMKMINIIVRNISGGEK